LVPFLGTIGFAVLAIDWVMESNAGWIDRSLNLRGYIKLHGSALSMFRYCRVGDL